MSNYRTTISFYFVPFAASSHSFFISFYHLTVDYITIIMKVPQILAAFLLTVGSQHALAAPVNDKEVRDLETRSTSTGNNAAGGNTASDPIEVEINVSYDSAVTFDADCWAMLCKGKPHVLYVVHTDPC